MFDAEELTIAFQMTVNVIDEDVVRPIGSCVKWRNGKTFIDIDCRWRDGTVGD
ncbi:hypothetical protein QMG96_11745 [Lactiplantibacillus plantarum]|uniref:hypothetical protein n=1 Tax=Lactiplantibacillus plantarum TaxID=1590 RepID=UPI00030ABCCB|nr:hypothetical protein [Lactiplantibacillus plantarum]MCH8625414.1 hypothetical protein [Lactiplantibacillus plantarum]WKE61544.1 hypothetical protein QMG96_11745 [Lactiplantibacillus plantarum]WQH18619.1 hypothetical protein T1I15_00050 [Lactiplantibacillus plantarum]